MHKINDAKSRPIFQVKNHVDYAHNFSLEITRILCILQYEKPRFALRASFISQDDRLVVYGNFRGSQGKFDILTHAAI